MGTVFTKQNLMMAGIATVAALLAQNLTSTKSKLIQGGAMVLAVAVAMPFIGKAVAKVG